MKPAIVVVTHSRAFSLKRLLNSIQIANYHQLNDIPLIISIDGGAQNHDEIVSIAKGFEWKYGIKQIVEHRENLGLRKHIISCGDLSEKFGAVIVLEDDLYVSKEFYSYSKSALEFYKEDDKIAGIGLYSYFRNQHAELPFNPIKSNYDAYFIQHPTSWGQSWTKKQWLEFKNWYANKPIINKNDKLPIDVKIWPESSWLKYFFKYMVEKNKYFVYPYLGYSTNFSDQGTHKIRSSNLYQVNLNNQTVFKFQEFTNDCVKYDGFFEICSDYIKKYNKKLENFDFEMNLYGIKSLEHVERKYMISVLKCKKPIYKFSLLLKPHEFNILNNINESPDIISFGKTNDFLKKNLSYYTQLDFFDSVGGIKKLTFLLIKKVCAKLVNSKGYLKL